MLAHPGELYCANNGVSRACIPIDINSVMLLDIENQVGTNEAHDKVLNYGQAPIVYC